MPESTYFFHNWARERWTVTRNGEIGVGEQPWILDDTGCINGMGDFRTKRKAQTWISNGCPVEDGETLIWAKNSQDAFRQSQALPESKKK